MHDIDMLSGEQVTIGFLILVLAIVFFQFDIPEAKLLAKIFGGMWAVYTAIIVKKYLI